ncbi:MAG TPA: 4a-hydroxytetrahydrobiopterin dehydratase [Aggregatilineales bacterium]|nr:4a-hydroxytetrahydrobiopterin dehydratase [Anaerolineales bacterium]HRE47096.1 4a-hydroxytetrahydrobiopterin dehydratase [Aggregatilineales bacterium]
MPLQKLTDQDIQSYLAQTEGWALDPQTGEITRTYTFKDFTLALAFVGLVGYLAEKAGHHPDMLITYNKVKLALVTHDAGGLTEKDFALARQVNGLV